MFTLAMITLCRNKLPCVCPSKPVGDDMSKEEIPSWIFCLTILTPNIFLSEALSNLSKQLEISFHHNLATRLKQYSKIRYVSLQQTAKVLKNKTVNTNNDNNSFNRLDVFS